MNKKGTIVFLIVWGAFAALGIFFSFTADLDLERGEWHQEFLEVFTEAEKTLLRFDVELENQMQRSILELAEKGGWAGDSSCDKVDSYNVWKEGCFPRVEEEFRKQFQHDLGVLMQIDSFTKKIIGNQDLTKDNLAEFKYDLKLEDNILKGKTDQYFSFKEGMYKIKPGFVLYTAYDFTEFTSVMGEANKLLEECKGKSDLQKCITDKKEENWLFNDCADQEVEWSSKKIKFCVKSSQVVNIIEEFTFKSFLAGAEDLSRYCRSSSPEQVKYLFALDFN